MTDTTNKLDYSWWGGIKTADTIYQQFLTIAEGSAVLDKGDYELSITWDDAVRLYVDGKLLLDQWDASTSTYDEAPNRKIRLSLRGRHHFRIEHVESGGFATLRFQLNKR